MDIHRPSPPLRDRLLGPTHADNRDESDVFVKPRHRRAGPALEGTHVLAMPPERPPSRSGSGQSRPLVLYSDDGQIQVSTRDKGRRHDGRL